jgi:hypothetical protein
MARVGAAGDAGALTRSAGKEGAAPEESAASRPGGIRDTRPIARGGPGAS